MQQPTLTEPSKPLAASAPLLSSADAKPAGLTLRAARPEDAGAIADLINLPGYRRGTLRLPFDAPQEVRAWLERASPGSRHVLAIIDGEVVGNAGLDRLTGRRAHVGTIGMGVHDAWTGRGIGRALLTTLLETADQWLDLRRLELTVYTDNAPAMALYRRSGFVIEGTHRAYAFRNGYYVDAHTMARTRP
jgi:L-phenylalanine/L-methionine N-acetyltransferase